jgi:hypothetical protein
VIYYNKSVHNKHFTLIILSLLSIIQVSYYMKKLAALTIVGLASLVATHSTVKSNLKMYPSGKETMTRTRFGHIQSIASWEDGMVKTVFVNNKPFREDYERQT